MDIQTIGVIIAAAASIWFLANRARKTAKGKNVSCGCGCDSCGADKPSSCPSAGKDG